MTNRIYDMNGMSGASGIRIRSTVYYVSVPKVILIDLMRCCVYNDIGVKTINKFAPIPIVP